ncbi:V-type proton ATPase subunit e 1 [Trichoplax sp. H2]|nr:V-type proton ATPase subunit e 1 [Trichoplax sp. H2]|eukprot:RDD38781.1 V-type proton ATPase subunit e 1 [Trichoplax sp. H2]
MSGLPAFLGITFSWLFIGAVVPFLIPKANTNRGWLIVFLAQLNPLIGPELNNHTLHIMIQQWGRRDG